MSNWQSTLTTISGLLFGALVAFGVFSPEQEMAARDVLAAIAGTIGGIIALIASFKKDKDEAAKLAL